MFTPHRVAGGPEAKVQLEGTRVTTGTYVASGKTFKIVDSYLVADDAHRLLQHAWIGTTEFLERKIDNPVSTLYSLAMRKWRPASISSSDRAVGEPGQRSADFGSSVYRRIKSRWATRMSSKRTACGVAPVDSVVNSGDYSLCLFDKPPTRSGCLFTRRHGTSAEGECQAGTGQTSIATHFQRRLYSRAYQTEGQTYKRNANAFWLKAISGNGKTGYRRSHVCCSRRRLDCD